MSTGECRLSRMIFTYWDPDGDKQLRNGPASVQHWRNAFSDFAVFGDADVLPILSASFPDLERLYRRVRIPACKADVARWALLWKHGGMYVDAHTHPTDVDRIRQLQSCLTHYDLVLLDRVYDHNAFNPLKLTNSVILATEKNAQALQILSKIGENLLAHSDAERRYNLAAPYNVYVLTGPRAMRAALFDESERPYRLLDHFEERTLIYPIEQRALSPIEFYRHYEYRKPLSHWSERQLSERLFHEAQDPSRE